MSMLYFRRFEWSNGQVETYLLFALC